MLGMIKDMLKLKKQADRLLPPEQRGLRGAMRGAREGAAQATQMLSDLADAAALRANGRPGTATITAIRETGLTINENPVIDLDLQVSVGGNPPYALTHRQTISRLHLGNFQPGATVPVHVDPADPAVLVVG